MRKTRFFKLGKVLLLPLLFSGLPTHAAEVRGGVPPLVINEILASNVSIFPDNSDVDDYSDWIELYNPSESSQSLENFFLTDDLTNPTRWAFPSSTTIGPNSYLVVRADGSDIGPGELLKKTFSPWDRFLTVHHHTSFKLAAQGEELGLFYHAGPTVQIRLISLRSIWSYLDNGQEPPADWLLRSYDDEPWRRGRAPLGYGEDEFTTIEYGTDEELKHRSYYFRHPFEIEDPKRLTHLRLRLMVDDGAVVYLNGSEVFRVRMPDGELDHETLANGYADEGFFHLAGIDPKYLRAGENLVAVRVHQATPYSSDLSFELELNAVELSVDPVLVDSVDFGQQYPDVSWARDPESPNHWQYQADPTPGKANNRTSVTELLCSGVVSFSLASGTYDSEQFLELSTESTEGQIYYTQDGSAPTTDSLLYREPLTIHQSGTVRARNFEPGKLASPVVTQTYLFEEKSMDLPTVALSVDPALMFGDEKGIYQNEYKGREIVGHLEFFEPNGASSFAAPVGVKLAGENIWRFAQKPFTITLRNRYGQGSFDYPLFEDRHASVYRRFSLRNGGDNWVNAMLRDALTPYLFSGQSSVDTQAYQPCRTYINGDYWGIYNIRERFDDQYFATHHQIYPGTYDYLKFGRGEDGLIALFAEGGTTESYRDLVHYAATHDLSNPDFYAAIGQMMDLESFIDFIAIEEFVCNTSWEHNREFWRAHGSGGKWHWIVTDLDRGFRWENIRWNLFEEFIEEYPLFRHLSQSRLFREEFGQRISGHFSSSFHPDRISGIVDRLDDGVASEIANHISRWSAEDGISSIRSRADELREVKDFAVERERYVREGIAEYLGLTETVSLTFRVNPPDTGTVSIQGVPLLPEYSETANVYRGVPLTISAKPGSGFRFIGWSHSLGPAEETRFTPGEDMTVIAEFATSNETVLPLKITEDRRLEIQSSPYVISQSLEIPRGVTLSVEGGVTVRLAEDADLLVHGALLVNGESDRPVVFEPRISGERWGAIAFLNPSEESRLTHTRVVGGSSGRRSSEWKGALSNIGSKLHVEHAFLDASSTIYARGGDTTVESSKIHVSSSGDGVNVKYGAGRVENCTFVGGSAPDTDGIDFDGVVDGTIRDNRIYAFKGDNSDGIDVGEGCVNLHVTGNRIYHCSDKGISVGQGSSVVIEDNLIVGCTLGVGVKDHGSVAEVRNVTFVNNEIGVSVYEKNLLKGGGIASVSNCIFSQSATAPVMRDNQSQLSVRYSLSDTDDLSGEANLKAEPKFWGALSYDFSLAEDSPALDAGDPRVRRDPDGTRADIGMSYHYNPTDYPNYSPGSVVVNEVMANSESHRPDWIEIHNRNNTEIDLGGWFLSDDPETRRKYEIPPGTILPSKGYVVFYEDIHFGGQDAESKGSLPFGLSRNGESVLLYRPQDSSTLEYLDLRTFGPSQVGVSLGLAVDGAYKAAPLSLLAKPTPGLENGRARIGPIVMSEIMYHPDTPGNAEFIELLNISSEPVTFYDPTARAPWSFTEGIEHTFPSDSPLVLLPRMRLVLTRDSDALASWYEVSEDTLVVQWQGGALDNKGESITLSRPGDLDSKGRRRFFPVDQIKFDDLELWPAGADGHGFSLHRKLNGNSGRLAADWIASDPTPGTPWNDLAPTYPTWTESMGLEVDVSGPEDDPDGDGISNLLEYAFKLSPFEPDPPVELTLSLNEELMTVTTPYFRSSTDLRVALEENNSLGGNTWIPVDADIEHDEHLTARSRLTASVPISGDQKYIGMRVWLQH